MRLVPVLLALMVLVGLLAMTPITQEPQAYRVFIPLVIQPPWVDDPAKGIAGFVPYGESARQRHHWQMMWNLTLTCDPEVNCIHHLKKLSDMNDYYPDRPELLTQTMQACSGGEWWFGDETNLYMQPAQAVSEVHYIRELFDKWAPKDCRFGFGSPLIGSGWWGMNGDEWIKTTYNLYSETYGLPLKVDVFVVDDYYHGPVTYDEAVATHALIRSLYGDDTLIAAREWGCLGTGCQRLALDYACETGWHKLYDRYLWFIGNADSRGVWTHTALYNEGQMTDLGRTYAAFPSWYCGSLWEEW